MQPKASKIYKSKNLSRYANNTEHSATDMLFMSKQEKKISLVAGHKLLIYGQCSMAKCQRNRLEFIKNGWDFLPD